jgi:hypothetical protein
MLEGRAPVPGDETAPCRGRVHHRRSPTRCGSASMNPGVGHFELIR